MKLLKVLVVTAWPALGIGCDGPRHVPGPEVFSLEPIARVGSADGRLALRSILSVALSQSELPRVYVSQFGVPSLLVLSPDGDSIGSIGRSGSGPGEFRGSSVGLHLHQDTLWLSDFDGTVSLYSTGGAFLADLDLLLEPLGAFQHNPNFVGAFADGTVLLKGGLSASRMLRGELESVPLERASREGDLLGTLAQLRVAGGFFMLRFSESGGGMTGIHPMSTADMLSVDPMGRWVVVARNSDRIGRVRPFSG